MGSNLSLSERKYLVSLTTEELRQLLDTNYNGAQDRASLIFAILSGRSVPNNNIDPIRYEKIRNYRSTVVYNLAFNQYKIIDHNAGIYSLQPPHIYLAQQSESPIETLISNIDRNNCQKLIEQLGIISKGYNDDILQLSNEEQFAYLQGELSLYHNVFNRPEGLIQPSPIADVPHEDVFNILSYYTNDELATTYDPRSKWYSRNDLLRQIYNDITGGVRWSFTHRHCTNDDTMNVLTADQHGDMNNDDPTLSFGIHKNYRCYQCSELEPSFREYDGAFAFRVPDWIPNTIKDFPLDSMKQLQILLETAPPGYNITSLLNKIKIGLDVFGSAQNANVMS